MLEVFILANGNSEIGMGHIHRSLMIAKNLRKHGVLITYLSSNNDSKAVSLIEPWANINNVSLNNRTGTSELYTNAMDALTKKGSTALLYVDSDANEFYSESFQKGVIDKGYKLMYATLNNTVHYYAHILLNQNILALSQKYATELYTKRLLGPEYFLWPEKAMAIQPQSDFVNKESYTVFVNFGNADPSNLTYQIVKVIKSYPQYFAKVIIVIGSLYPHTNALKSLVKGLKEPIIEVYENVSNIFELMKQSDFAISSLGMTFWELTYMHIPSIIIPGSEREKPVGDYMDQHGYGLKLCESNDLGNLKSSGARLNEILSNKELITLRTKVLAKMINKRGIDLVVKEMLQLSK